MPPIKKPQATRCGFTLIEMVISLTILALVVTVLYLAFSTAGRVWSRQQTDGGRGERESALARLLHDDFGSLAPYSFSSKKGAGFFFALGPKAMFYATTSGFGAGSRVDGGLYFACLYLVDGSPDQAADESPAKDSETGPEGAGQTLYLVKELGPKEYLLEALHNFVTRPESGLQMEEKFKKASIPVLSGLEEASFAVVVDPEKLRPDEAEPDSGALQEKLRPRRYSRKTLPGLVLFQYREGGRRRRFFLEAAIPPPLPDKKKRSSQGRKK